MSLAYALLVSATLAAPQKVAVVPYQGLGAAPGAVERLSAALRAAVADRTWPVAAPDEVDRKARAASMCGEDLECLSTLGQRLEVSHVVAFGVGKVGPDTMVSALLVEVASGKKLGEFSERLPALPEDAGPLSRRAADALFQDLKPAPVLVPADVPAPPVVIAPALPSHPLRPLAIGTAVGAGVLAIGGGVLTVVAQQHYAGLADVEPNARPAADAEQRGLNVAADVTVITAGVAAAVAVVLFIVDGKEASP